MAAVHSPNWDEMAHLPSGLSHWQFGRFDLYRVNPPLVRMIAAIPVLFADVQADWSIYSDELYSRPEFSVGQRFIEINGRDAFWYYILARWALIPVCLIGPWIAYRWAAQLYGQSSGILAITLYCFCPNLLAWGASITPDAAAASLGLLATYTFWRWLRSPTWPNALGAGAALGIAQLTKSSWVVLFGLWPLLWMVYQGFPWGNPPQETFGGRRASARQLTVILLLAVYLLNLGYGFEESFKPLREYVFISRALTDEDSPPAGGNRFRFSVWGFLPVPFPANYVRGIDVQRFDFEQKKWSYLRGEQRLGGWWYYYLYALAVKTPIGTLVLLAGAVILYFLCRRTPGLWRDELILVAPALVLFTLVSSQTGFSKYFRYVVPTLPFLYIAIARLTLLGQVQHRDQPPDLRNRPSEQCHRASRVRVVSAMLISVIAIASVAESLSVLPHSHSFFNRLFGGPLGGHAHLVDANIDWGEDIPFLKEWCDRHPHARPIYWAYFGGYHPDEAVSGVHWEPIPEIIHGEEARTAAGLPPGWYVVSVNYLRGYRHLPHDTPVHVHFLEREPVARIGYSMYVYHIDAAANSTSR
jgi:hypothetical protein